MIAKHTKVLRNPKKPSEGFVTNESFEISKNLKSKVLSEASIILDIAEHKIVKNRFPDRDFDELFKYFSMHYADYINKWVNGQNR